MTQHSDYLGGYKHHQTKKYLEYLKQDLMEVCRKEKLHQVDLLSPAKKRVTEKEYWANTRGKRAHGTDFVLRKDKLRKAIEECSKKAKRWAPNKMN